MKRVLVVASVCAVALCNGAVKVGENLLRTDFAGDGVGGILNWSVCRSLGGVNTERLQEKGPDGFPVLRISGGIGKFSYDHSMSKFVPGERFRLSVNVRTHALDPNGRNEFEVYNGGWRWSGIAKLPADTAGKWVEVAWEGTLKDSPGDAYNCAFYFTGIPQGAYADVSNPRMVPLTEKAVSLSADTCSSSRRVPASAESFISVAWRRCSVKEPLAVDADKAFAERSCKRTFPEVEETVAVSATEAVS